MDNYPQRVTGSTEWCNLSWTAYTCCEDEVSILLDAKGVLTSHFNLEGNNDLIGHGMGDWVQKWS